MAKNKRNHNSHYASPIEPERDDRLEFNGVIDEALPGTLFKVKCENGMNVLCTLAGKLRMNHIRLLPGDPVKIEVSPYDTSRGRVVWRGK
jgi:translation initiation factor IF-1